MKIESASGTIYPAPPFDFEKSLKFLGEFPPTRGEQKVQDRELTKIVSVRECPVVFQLRAVGTTEKPALHYTLFAQSLLARETQSAALDRIRFFLSLDDDLSDFYRTAKNDRLFAPLVKKLYGLHQVKFLTPFENAVWAVLAQRVPIGVARHSKGALVEKYGAMLEVDGVTFRAFPEASQLVKLDIRELNAVIGNERKAEYVRAVIDAFARVDEQFLRVGDYAQVQAWLRGIKGIGEWSADFILLRGLGRMEDLHIASKSIFEKRMSAAVSKVYAPGRRLSGEQILDIAQTYGEWQGYWAYYLRTAA